MKKRVLWMIALLCTSPFGGWGAGAWAQDNPTTVSSEDNLTAAINRGDANIQLTGNILLSNYLNINGKTVTIDLNGNKLYRELSSSADDGHIFWVHPNGNNDGGHLTIEDSSNAKSGSIEGGYAPNGGGINVWPGCSLTISDVTFKNNHAGNMGGAIFVREGATVTINNVTFTGNSAGDHGGAIWNSGTVTATNCTFTGNSADDVGALYNAVQTEGNVTYAGSATLTGCTFTGNSSSTSAGALANAEGATVMTIDGCTIQNNTAVSNGGGIWNGGTLNMKGKVTVTGNKKASGVDHNVFLKSGTIITVTGSLAGSAIGIEKEGTSGTFTSGYNSYNNGVAPATIFTPDLAVIVSLTLDTTGEACLTATGSVYFVERSWDATSKQVVSTLRGLTELIAYGDVPTEGQYKEVTNAPADSPNEWFGMGGYSTSVAEYYVVRGDVSRQTIVVQGKDVHLILCNGARLTLTGGLKLEGDNKLHIHCQSYVGDMGQLIVSNSYDNAAGIGSAWTTDNVEQEVGELVIHGGYIVATGGARGAGIGSCTRKTDGKSQLCKSVTVYGGYVSAKGGTGAAGIGSGSMEVNGVYNDYCTAGAVYIYDGTVEATGKEGGAGIGGGRKGRGATVYIYGGTVSARGGEETIEETDDTTTSVPADYGGAGIGGGTNGRGGDVTISGGTVFAWAAAQKENNRAIGSGSFNENNGSLDIGNEMMVKAGNNSVDKIIYNADKRLDACSSCYYAEVLPCTHSGSTYTIVDGFTHHHNTCAYCLISSNAPQDHAFDSSGKCCCGLIGIDDADDNGAIGAWSGVANQSVTFAGRKLYKDGEWNTLCLPFSLTSLEDTPLAGATVKTLESASFENGTLTLNFTDNLNAIEAGKPYIVKWSTTTPDYIENPVFTGITISNALTEVKCADGTVTFVGTYSPISFDSEDKSILFLGSGSTLYYPDGKSSTTIGSCRAYFQLNGITAGTPSSPGIRAFVLNFGEGEQTGIFSATLNDKGQMINDKWYSLDGRKLNGKPTMKGLYINNGKAVVIK